MNRDAYDLYTALWKFIVSNGLQSEVTDGIKNCETNGEIIALIRRITGIYNDSDDPFNLSRLKDDVKNETKAVESRKSGNAYFHPNVKRYIKAVECYNESIALSPERSENMAFAYANRSAVCFKLKEYNDCLKNIHLARDSQYPKHLLAKLDERERDCFEFLKKNKERQVFEGDHRVPKLSYKSNPKIPHISDCIELKEDKEYGRYLITNRNLSAGDIVIEEKPFSTLLVENLCYTHCDYCHEDKFLTLIPCRTCTVTMFCSEECQKYAWETYHRIECSVIKSMRFLFTKVILVALRTVIQAISTFHYNIEELRLFIQSIDESALHPFMLDWTSIDPKYVYSTIHVLSTNQKLRDTSDLVQRSVYAIIMSDILFQRTELGQLCNNNESRDLIRQLIFHHSQTSPVNMHSLMFMDYTPNEYDKFESIHLACGSFPILSMINHSCAPNLVRMTLRNGNVAVLLNRPIKKGGQLFDNYGFHHSLESLAERQNGLRRQYCFPCQCEACKLNYPLYQNLPSIKLSSKFKQPIDMEVINRIQDNDIATALRKIPDFCNYLNTFDSQYPNYEISTVQEALLRCYLILFGMQSRKFKYRELCAF